MGLLDEIRLKGAEYRLTEEAIYGEVLHEIENGIRRDGLWAKALAESRDSVEQAKSRYIRLRVQALKDEIAVARISMAGLASTAAKESKQRAIQEAKDEATRAARQEQIQRDRDSAAAEADWNRKASREKKISHLKKFLIWSVITLVFLMLSGFSNWDSKATTTIDKLRPLFVGPAIITFAMALLSLIESLKRNPRR
jgi:hypothetical protein